MKPRFANSPWRVEVSPGELVVVDSRDMVVCSFPTDLEELENISLDQVKKRAYGIAALPAIFEKASSFYADLCDPVKQLDEALLMAGAEEMNTALLSAEVPAKAPIPPPPVVDTPPPLAERESLRDRRRARG